MQDAIKCVFCF